MKIELSDSMNDAVGLFRALSDPVRLRLLNLLASVDEVCVCHLHAALDLPQPTVSRHLATLRTSGLAATSKRGLWVYYRLARPGSKLHRILVDCVKASQIDSATLSADRDRLQIVRACCGEA